MTFGYTDALFIGIWALIGSVLGFFAFSNSPDKTPLERFKRCCLSIGIGLFIAFPLCTYLEELDKFSKHLNIMLGGLGAFGLPDFIIKHWPTVINAIATKVLNNTVDNHTKGRNKQRYEDEE